MRESSSTLPSLIGTLKSTRINTRWPRRGRSLMESLATKKHKKHKNKTPLNRQLAIGNRKCLQALARDVLDQITHAARIAPLVVVPRKHLQHASANHFRVLRIHDRRV